MPQGHRGQEPPPIYDQQRSVHVLNPLIISLYLKILSAKKFKKSAAWDALLLPQNAFVAVIGSSTVPVLAPPSDWIHHP